MGKTEPTEATLEQLRVRFPVSLIGSWSTFGDGYQMEYGHIATFHANGSGEFEMWNTFDEDVPERQNLPFLWQVKDGFEVEVKPRSLDGACPTDWGTFEVDFFISEDAYNNKSVAIRDRLANEGGEPFWWFLEPDKHPMRLLEAQ